MTKTRRNLRWCGAVRTKLLPEEIGLAGQPTPADPAPAEDASLPEWRGWGQPASPTWVMTPPPWRVEGLKPKDQDRTGGRTAGHGLWLIMLGLLIVNWVLSSLFIGSNVSNDDLLHVLRDPGEVRQRRVCHLDR